MNFSSEQQLTKPGRVELSSNTRGDTFELSGGTSEDQGNIC